MLAFLSVMALAVVLLGGALSAFGSSPGTGVYTPVSAEVEAFDPDRKSGV